MRRAVALVVVAGCWSQAVTTDPVVVVPPAQPAPKPYTREEPVHQRPALRTSLPRHSVWSGTYVCNQGLTGVTLTIDRNSTVATVLFEFGPIEQNPTVPKQGASRLVGTIDESPEGGVTIDADPSEWVSQPPGYFMVGITATTDSRLREMHGIMKAESCGRIDVQRER